MAMRVLIALGVLSATTGPSLAQGVTHTYASGWTSTDFADASNPGCSIGSEGSIPGGRIIMGASMRKPSPVDLVIRRTAWSLRDATMRVRAVFPDGTTMTLFGRGHGQEIDIDLDAGMLPGWIHMLTASPAMQLVFDGTEPPWQVDLSGATKVVNAMGDCIRNHNISGVPAPLTPNSFAQPTPSPPFGNPSSSSSGGGSFAQAMSQMGHLRSDVVPPSQPASAPSTPVAPTAPVPAPSPTYNPPLSSPASTEAVKPAFDCMAIASAQDRLACYDTARKGITAPAAAPPATMQPVPPLSPGSTQQADLEKAFILVLQSSASAYANAANDMQAGGLRAHRAQQLCQTLPGGRIVEWVGTVNTLSSNNSGYGVLTITIAPGITVGTSNNSLSDGLLDELTLIPPGSPLFNQAAALSQGTHVRFSGHLLAGSTDCFDETSLTQSGSMKAPNFMVKFSSVAPQ